MSALIVQAQLPDCVIVTSTFSGGDGDGGRGEGVAGDGGAAVVVAAPHSSDVYSSKSSIAARWAPLNFKLMGSKGLPGDGSDGYVSGQYAEKPAFLIPGPLNANKTINIERTSVSREGSMTSFPRGR